MPGEECAGEEVAGLLGVGGQVEDIEDIMGGEEVEPRERYQNKELLVPRVRKKRRKALENQDEIKIEENKVDQIGLKEEVRVPGTGSVFVKTWGCAHNSSDSEYMAGQLAAEGYTMAANPEDADLWLLNSCTVKNPAEEHFKNEVKRGLDSNKKVVVAGCVPQGKQSAEYLKGLSMIGVQQIDRVVDVVEETLKGNSVKMFGTKKEEGKKVGGARLDLPKIRRNPLVEIIAINTGCLNQCTYCKTRHARGELGSYPPEEIVARAEQSFNEGVCEIWLTSEDTGAYGRDIGTSLPELLWKLVEVIPEGCRLRLGMTNPPYILDHLEEMAEILKHPRVYRFLHVPVQAGSDAVLGDMRREYTVAEFSRVVDFLKERVDGLTIVTDIIAGFPTETHEDWEETMDLCRKYKFPSLFINQFFPRPGTPAAKMKRIDTAEVKKRTRELTSLFHSYHPYEGREGEEYDVLVTDTSHDGAYFVGHNERYEQVLVPKEEVLMGKIFKVRIVSTSKFSMVGELVKSGSVVRPAPRAALSKGEVSGVQEQLRSTASLSSSLFVPSVAILAVALILRISYLIFS